MTVAIYLLPLLAAVCGSQLCDNSSCSTISVPTIEDTTPAFQQDHGTTKIEVQNITEDTTVSDVTEDSLARNRRSQLGFVRFLRNLFATNTSRDEVNHTAVRTSYTGKDEGYNDVLDKDNKEIYILYNLNESLQKLVTVLTILANGNLRTYSVVDLPVLMRTKREVNSNVTVIHLNAKSNVTNEGNVTNDSNNTRVIESREVENGTDGNVTRVSDVTNGGNKTENVTKTRITNTTDYQASNISDIRSNMTTTVENVTDSNMTISRKSNTDENGPHLLIKSVLKLLHTQIADIKSIKVESDESFKIGYILSSLETLELTIKKIMSRMPAYVDDIWTRKISVKMERAAKVVSDLMQHLKTHTNLLPDN